MQDKCLFATHGESGTALILLPLLNMMKHDKPLKGKGGKDINTDCCRAF